ncbi:hypothetical protein HPP92_005017 [Vanilla planifolia]|uniref:DUF1771 domain-containing protein n=1 Tax=Vanilla planifolia TaxID=51239 RepID=A0A835V8N7_VANPL|nr:hypothetical protein HPP92_005017 [Vanilla planifolia]
MASSGSCVVGADDVHLKALYDAFCSSCTLEDIALAYIKAGHNVDKAGEILCKLHGSNLGDASRDFEDEASLKHPQETSDKGHTVSSIPLDRNYNGRKHKKVSASGGTVSSFLGKDYLRFSSSVYEPSQAMKPPKVSVFEPLATDSEVGTVEEQNFPVNVSRQIRTNADVEEFLFSMLGDGFKLSMDNIRVVLGNCGYNAKQSMEKLLSISEKRLYDGKPAVNRTNMETSCHEVECKKLPSESRSAESRSWDKNKKNLSREVLESLFIVADRFEEEPRIKRLELGINRTRVIGQKPVTKPFEELALCHLPEIELTQPASSNHDEDNYQVLRKAAKQHWNTMKLYYEAAVDAFTKGDHAQASYCLEQGKNNYQLAREADEKSTDMILERREQDEKEGELFLDLQAQSANQSIQLLKLHLLSLAGIPSFRCLKVTVHTDDDGTSRGRRRREMVLKFLENESIRWTKVEGSPGKILIPLDEIDRNKLNFKADDS